MEQDDWGRDPAVRQTRNIFAEMEQIQKTLLDHARISPFDGRLRAVRATALSLFDRAAACAAGRSIPLTDTAMAGLYGGCFQQALSNAGIAVSRDFFTDDRLLQDLVREVSR